MRRRIPRVALRERLAQAADDFAAQYGHINPKLWDRGTLLRSGAAVTAHGWEISDWAPGIDPSAHYRLATDDTLADEVADPQPDQAGPR